MAGYTLQGKTSEGTMVDIPLVATYDANGNAIVDYYAAKTDCENISVISEDMVDSLF